MRWAAAGCRCAWCGGRGSVHMQSERGRKHGQTQYRRQEACVCEEWVAAGSRGIGGTRNRHCEW